ncbi:HD domain-containing protein [Alkaliphilus transvaalensis]|uniref:HD domain-containing protein n=1 Tax=Alkaliphilus transvaalensis TaxID=114628 RepID=UPI00047D439B|nr:HD domain-containing protein [Alkaliphilus transvaalensis]
MKIIDSIYGEFEVEGVLEALILSKPLQRLKGVYQGGASYLVNKRWNVTRYHHSVGVMLLVRKLGGSLEEQIAGLLHDVSHTAFSHVIDFVLKDKRSYHEKIFKEVIERSEIPTILKRYGYNYSGILLNLDKWTLMEASLPDLCCDRIDYTLRDLYEYGHISQQEINDFIDHLIVIDGRLFLRDIKVAEWFVRAYNQEVIEFFMDPLNIYGYDTLAKTLKLAIDKKILRLEDLQATDQEVMDILKQSNDPAIIDMISKLHTNVIVKEDNEVYDLHLIKKIRIVDPLISSSAGTQRASNLSSKIREMNSEAYEKAVKGKFVRVISN